jgi:hypothetical protein
VATHLFKQPPPPPQNFTTDPYGPPQNLRAWDDYQFRGKGVRGSGGAPALSPPVNVVPPVAAGHFVAGFYVHSTEGAWTGTRPIHYDYQWFRTPFGDPPTVVVPPDIDGTETEGETLSSDTGTWSGTEPLTYAYQWFRTGSAPVSVEAPTVSGTEIEGETLEALHGMWSGSEPITYEYQWFRTTAGAPSPTLAPVISGSVVAGNTLHSTTGNWEGTGPITYHYQWTQLPSTPVGTDSADFTTSPADIGKSFTCTVTAVNAFGSDSEPASNSRGPIVEAPPVEVLTTEGVPLTVDGEDLTI